MAVWTLAVGAMGAQTPPGIHDEQLEEKDPRFVVPRRSAGDVLARIPASILVEDVFRQVLVESIRQPGRGGALIADWQQQIVDLASGFPVDTTSYFHLELARQRVTKAVSSRGSSAGSPTVSAREIQQSRLLPGLGCLQKMQRGVLAELTRFEGEALVSLVSIYLEVYSEQTLPPPAFWLRNHTRDFILELAEKHYEETGSLELFLAHLMALADIQRGLMIYDDGLDALVLFERVLDFDPHHLVARYWAGYLAEKYGEYVRARRHYERFLETEAADPEVRLRLAVNQLRTGQRDRGDPALGALARDTGVSGWMRRVAWSELVRAVGEDERRAVALLREALATFPKDPGLHLQLAYHRRSQAWNEALGELERAVEVGLESEEGSGRVTYDWPREEGLAKNQAWLEEQRRTRRAAVLAALDRLEKKWRFEADSHRRVIRHCEEIRPQGGVP